MALLSVEKRENLKKSALNRLRKSGRIPGVLYGKNVESTPLSMDAAEFLQAIKKNRTGLLQISLDGENHSVMVQDVQKDDITNEIKHVDLKKVSLNEMVDVEVPIQLIGQAKDGVIQQQLRELKVRCYPNEIPANILVNISHLESGDSVRVRDLDISEQVKVLHDGEEIVVTMVEPQLEPVEDEMGEEMKEPEVVGAKDGPGLDEAR